jgi:hypothetical protein
MASEENKGRVDQITENRHNCTIYPALDNTQTKEHRVFGYASYYTFRKKSISISERKSPCNRRRRFNES